MKKFSLDYFLLFLAFVVIAFIAYAQGISQFTMLWLCSSFVYCLLSYVCIKYLNKLVSFSKVSYAIASFVCFLPLIREIVITTYNLRFPPNELFTLSDIVLNVLRFVFYAPIFPILYFSIRANKKLESRNTENISNDALSQLGQSDTSSDRHLDIVIKSLLERANASLKMTTTSLVIMITIVFVGGGASIGTIALNDLNSVRELEKERNKVVDLKNLLVSRLNEKRDSAIIEADNRIISNIRFAFYDENGVLEKIGNKDAAVAFNWPDIAMRITIAALTLFLVQVFFHIYKYNQKQASQLFTRAETIELFKSENANNDELRTILLSKIASDSSFDKSPPSPTEQIINVIERATSK